MGRKSFIAGLVALTLLAGSYFYSPKVQHSVNRVAFNTYLTINPDPVPPIENIPAVARYVDRNIAPVGDFRCGGKNKLVFYFPDIHCTSFHKKHYKRIKKLHKAFGKSPVFIEGVAGKVDSSFLTEELEATLKNQENGKYSHLAKVEARLTRAKPRKIRNMNDLLEVSPLFSFTSSGLYGVDSRKNKMHLKRIEYLEEVYSYYFDRCRARIHNEDELKQNREDERFIERALRNMNNILTKNGISKTQELDILKRKAKVPKFRSEVLKNRKQLQTIKTGLDRTITLLTRELDKHISELRPDYVFSPYSVDKSSKTTQESKFYKQLFAAKDKAVLDVRSSTAAKLTLDNMKKLNASHASLVYGQGHCRQIIDELDKLGVSCIIIGKKPESSIGSKLVDALK